MRAILFFIFLFGFNLLYGQKTPLYPLRVVDVGFGYSPVIKGPGIEGYGLDGYLKTPDVSFGGNVQTSLIWNHFIRDNQSLQLGLGYFRTGLKGIVYTPSLYDSEMLDRHYLFYNLHVPHFKFGYHSVNKGSSKKFDIPLGGYVSWRVNIYFMIGQVRDKSTLLARPVANAHQDLEVNPFKLSWDSQLEFGKRYFIERGYCFYWGLKFNLLFGLRRLAWDNISPREEWSYPDNYAELNHFEFVKGASQRLSRFCNASLVVGVSMFKEKGQ
ncbi:MAG: hypothetical protein GYB31_00710 [Bacteroidetes bacterium]|nr:hypothetical protein [Bacteroidota bacterium]